MKSFSLKLLCVLFICDSFYCNAQPVEQLYLQNKTPQYEEVISFYQKLDKQYKSAKLITEGLTDAGIPLHLFVISGDGDFNPATAHAKNKCVLLINNGIHPGEPDGIDAGMLFAKQILSNRDKNVLKNIFICIIPIYNIDGSLNRGCCSRANQNGPQEYGFRGNAQNLDLNRDFIKCDSRNAMSFTQLFQKWNPDLFVDTHVSDGADYQYVLTLIATQKDKLTPSLGNYLDKKMLPALYKNMEARNISMTPYVDTYKDIPDSGIVGFLETPRFASGYAALFNTIGFITETHMLKPYQKRVEATLQFLQMITSYANTNATEILRERKAAIAECMNKTEFPLQWKLDSTKFEIIKFKGYAADYKLSTISGLQRLAYDRTKPFEKDIRYFNSYVPSLSITKPKAYIIPQSWQRVVERLKANGVVMEKISNDTTITVESSYIDDYKTGQRAYEGHYVHNNVKLRTEKQEKHFLKGDYIIYTNQSRIRYIIETLEPQATDSYFNWGFFDAILQQKEWFSDYVFEDIAEALIKKDSSLKQKLEDAKAKDSTMVNNHFQQLYFIYKNSPYFEKSYLRYPVYRLN